VSVTVILSEEYASGTSPAVFPGIPGVYVPGEPTRVDDDVAALIEQAQLPFEVTRKRPKRHAADALYSDDEADAEDEADDDEPEPDVPEPPSEDA
jgi:hypothetical protein